MPAICLYFKVHQPYRLKQYTPTDVTVNHCYEDQYADETIINQVADSSYLPVNEIIAGLLKKNKDQFKITYSISGVILELLQRYRPDVISSFKQLTKTGCIEILAETYYHSLSSIHSKNEFQRQVKQHADLIKKVFGLEPVVFRNTELIHNNGLAKYMAGLGFKGILCEGIARILKGRSVNNVYAAPDNGDFGLLLRNATLSDDIAFRFDDNNWSEYPLTADKFAEWIHAHPANTEVINLFLDYETFGIHKKKDTGIFDFIKALPEAVLSNSNFTFSTPSEVLENYYPKDIYDVPQTISWEDKMKENCVWSENVMQNNSLKKIYSIESLALGSSCEKMLNTWGRLQAADYFYYMSEERSGSNAGKYMNPFNSAREAFQNYTNIITDFELELINNEISKTKKTSFTKAFGLF
jgi:alpha-amylase